MGMSDMGDALNFWERNTSDLPLLSAMARVYLALSPGSVPVEQLFSTAGLILNGKRSQLSPSWMNMICFVHDNYKLVLMGQLENTVSERTLDNCFNQYIILSAVQLAVYYCTTCVVS